MKYRLAQNVVKKPKFMGNSLWLIIKNLAAEERKCQGKARMISHKTQGGLLKSYHRLAS